MSSSEFDPEAPTPKSDPAHPLKAQYPSAGQPTYKAPVPDVNVINADWNQVANAIDNIAVINGQIRDTLLGTNEALKSLKDELSTADDVRAGRGGGMGRFMRPAMHRPGESGYVPDRDIEPTTGFLQGRAASQQELESSRNEDIQRRVSRANLQRGSRFQEIYGEFQEAPQIDRMGMLRKYGVVNQEGKGPEGAFVGGKFATSEEITNALSTSPNARSNEQLDLVQILNQEFREKVTDALEKEAPRKIENILDAVEQAGIRQLRYGQLTFQDILRSVGTISGGAFVDIRRAQQYQADVATARAAGEPEPEKPEDLGAAGRSLLEGRMLGRALSTGPAAGALGFAARWAPVAGQAVAIGQIASQTIQNLYGRTYGSLYANPIRSGQVTGEGWRAGIGATIQGLKLGMNPFDLTSMSDARQIVSATRQQGFTGQQGRDTQESIRDVINDLGISVDQATQFFTDAMRRGGMSVDQVRKELEHFDDSAHDLNMSVQDYTQAILTQTQGLRGLGFGGAAPSIAQSISRALPVGYRNDPQAQQFFSQLIQQNRGALTARLNAQGIPANFLTVTSARFAGQTTRATDQLIQQDMNTAIQGLRSQGNANPDANDIANWMSQAGVFTKGSDPGFLAQYITRLRRGLGLGSQIQTNRALQRYNQAIRQGGRTRMSLGSMTDAELRQLGITEVTERHKAGPGRALDAARGLFRMVKGESVYSHHFENAQGKTISDDRMFTVQAGTDAVSTPDLIRARRAALAALPKNYLTPEERKILNYHIGDERFKFHGHDVDFAEALRRAGSETRNVDPNKATVNGITIELKGKAARDLFKLNVERTNAIQNGSLPANQNQSRVNGQ